MWTLRRASNLKKQGFSLRTYRVGLAPSEIATYNLGDQNAGLSEPKLMISHGSHFLTRLCNSASDTPKSYKGFCSFSSQAGTKSSGEEDDNLDDGFSELETSTASDAIPKSDVQNLDNDELFFASELSEEESGEDAIEEPQNELELSEAESDVAEKKSPRRRASSEMFKAILAAPTLSVHSIMNKWVEEGNEVTRSEISLAMLNLRRRRMYGRALQLSEWLESTKQHDFTERDYASRLDLIAKVRGLQKAENYIEKIPKSFRTEVVYRTLLANCVSASDLKKSEAVFNKMKDLEFAITCFACNQLLLLYKRIDKKKIADVLLLMEKENIKPSQFTYKILIDTKGQSNDINGMDQIVETMKAEGVEPDLSTQAIIVKHYIVGGAKEKAEAVLKEMEGSNIKENRRACQSLLPLYADLGKTDDVRRVWQVCESSPRLEECMAAVEAWGKLNNVEEAEAVFDLMAKKWKKLSSRHYSQLLKVYANNKMLTKGKDLVKRMADSGCRIGPLTWDALVKLYVEAGEVEKADSMLQKAVEQSRMKPMFTSFITIMDQYAKRGDVHNAEKMFRRMRQAGYESRLRQFQSLVQAYINAKLPAYGINERMKADNIFPNKALAAQLAQVDPFRKTAVSDLLD